MLKLLEIKSLYKESSEDNKLRELGSIIEKELESTGAKLRFSDWNEVVIDFLSDSAVYTFGISKKEAIKKFITNHVNPRYKISSGDSYKVQKVFERYSKHMGVYG